MKNNFKNIRKATTAVIAVFVLSITANASSRATLTDIKESLSIVITSYQEVLLKIEKQNEKIKELKLELTKYKSSQSDTSTQNKKDFLLADKKILEQFSKYKKDEKLFRNKEIYKINKSITEIKSSLKDEIEQLRLEHKQSLEIDTVEEDKVILDFIKNNKP